MSKNTFGLKTLRQEGLSYAEYYGDLVYKRLLAKQIFRNDLKILSLVTKKICYNMDTLRRTVYMVDNSIMVDNFASLLYCTRVGRSSD